MQVLARELAGLGWRISLVHLPEAARFITEPAVSFVPLPGPQGELGRYLACLAHPSGPVGLPRMIRATAALTDRLLAEAPAVLEQIGATAILADAVEPAGPLIAAKLGLPYAGVVTGLPLMGEASVPPPFVGWRYRRGALGRWRNRGGYAVADRLMQPVTRVLRERRRAWNLPPVDRAPQLQVAQCPQALDYPRRALPPGFYYGSPWRGDEPQEVALPDDGRPLVFCSLGTLQGARRALFATMAESCAAVGARAVIGHGGGLSPGEEAALPGDPLVRAFWPQAAVLRKCTAAVLHGGFNSVLDALAAGVPIVALPIGFEQPGTAARVAWTGAGLALSPHGLTTPRLSGALREVVEQPRFRAAASAIARSIAAAPGVRDAAAAVSGALSARP